MAKDDFRMVFNASKFSKELGDYPKNKLARSLALMKNEQKIEVGNAIIDEMKTVIAKGLSPIHGRGRFPAYKNAGLIKDTIANAKKDLSNSKAYKGLKGKKRQKFKEELFGAHTEKIKNAYPFSVQKEFPNKKIRPVNLYLSGEFLKNLKAKVEKRILLIGFFDEPWSLYEEGHREGVKGQPRRPIIPQGRERFSQSVHRRLVKALQEVFDKKKWFFTF